MYPIQVSGDVKVADAIWFTPGGTTLGIVRVVTPFETKYYIGVGKGYDENLDATHIAMYGTPFPSNAGAVLLPDYGPPIPYG